MPVVGTTGSNPSTYDWMVGPGDVDGDGRADLVAPGRCRDPVAAPRGVEVGWARAVSSARGFGAYKLGG